MDVGATTTAVIPVLTEAVASLQDIRRTKRDKMLGDAVAGGKNEGIEARLTL